MAAKKVPGFDQEIGIFGEYGRLNKWSSGDYDGALLDDEDTLKFFNFPAGTIIHDVTLIVNSGTASASADVGFEGDDLTDDADFFLDGVSLAAAAVRSSRANRVRTKVLTKPGNLVLTLDGADLATTSKLELQVEYQFRGTP